MSNSTSTSTSTYTLADLEARLLKMQADVMEFAKKNPLVFRLLGEMVCVGMSNHVNDTQVLKLAMLSQDPKVLYSLSVMLKHVGALPHVCEQFDDAFMEGVEITEEMEDFAGSFIALLESKDWELKAEFWQDLAVDVVADFDAHQRALMEADEDDEDDVDLSDCCFSEAVNPPVVPSAPVICRNWKENGSCKFGAKCRFAHPAPVEVAVAGGGAASRKPCSFWARDGSCRNGQSCKFAHGVPS
jgi:hypothetical protein